MSGSTLNSLDLGKYGDLLNQLFPQAASMQVRDTGDRVLWSAGMQPEASSGWHETVASVRHRQCDNGATACRIDLADPVGAPVGHIEIVLPCDAHTALAVATARLPAVGRLLVDEAGLAGECDMLAAELTERYEELNLVYQTRDEVDELVEGQQALEQLVRNCADYLDVEYASLILRDREIAIHHAGDSSDAGHPDGAAELLAGDVYDYVQAHAVAIVVNEGQSDLRDRLWADQPGNLLVVPVLNGAGAPAGILATIHGQSTRYFSNSDRNLLKVMAKKASRILQTHHDSLTGLMNRSGFEHYLLSNLSVSRSTGMEHCVLHFDILQLHAVNDLMGRPAGDALLQRMARLLRSSLRDSDFVARIGDDEFGVLLVNCSLDKGTAIAEKILARSEQLTVIAEGRQLQVALSAGVAPMNRDSDAIGGVLGSAEIACQAAKESGHNQVRTFASGNSTMVRRSREVEWLGRLQSSLQNDAFELHAQLVRPIDRRRNSDHFEILLRLRDDDGNMLSPAEFMPAAERFQQMPMIDRWVVRNTLRALSPAWAEIHHGKPVFCINLSGQSLTTDGFADFLADAIHDSGIPPASLCFEITETAAIANFDTAVGLIERIRELGVSFSLDDFGSGLSSFGYLKRLPVDYLKIDGSIVREMTTDAVSRSMVTAIATVGQSMGLETIAEYVEDEATIEQLAKIGIDYVQGYGVRKPIPLPAVLDEMTQRAETRSA